MHIFDQDATALLAATVKAAGCRYDQAILGADSTSRRMTARPSGFGLHAAGQRHSKPRHPLGLTASVWIGGIL
jgi:hypothetical protein